MQRLSLTFGTILRTSLSEQSPFDKWERGRGVGVLGERLLITATSPRAGAVDGWLGGGGGGGRRRGGGKGGRRGGSRYKTFPETLFRSLCEIRGGRPGLSVLTSLLVSVDVKNYSTVLRHWSQLVPNMSTDI